MTCPFSTARHSAAFRPLLFVLSCALLTLASCDSSGEQESLSLSPDVLDVQAEFEQEEGRDAYLVIELTNTADVQLSSASVEFRLWNGTTQITSIPALARGLSPNTTSEDRFLIIAVEDITDVECYTYRVSIQPRAGSSTQKEYPGTCPDDHPANQVVLFYG